MRNLVLLASTALIAACTSTAPVDPLLAPPPIDAEAGPAPAPAEPAPAAKNAELAALFDAYDKTNLAASPTGKSYRGIRDGDYGKWDDYSDAADVARQERLQATANTMRTSFNPQTLAPQDSLSWRLFDRNAKRSAILFPYRDLGYVFDQMNGAQSQFPAFMINIHSIANAEQAEAYISRLAGAGAAMDELISQSRAQAGKGVLPPKWVYPYVISDIDNVLKPGTGATMVGHPVIDDFRTKIAKLDLTPAQKAAMEKRAADAWKSGTAPAYRRLRTEMVRQQGLAGNDDGIWRLPRGPEYYNALLANYTTTDLTADQIHDIGLRETKRIQDEVRAVGSPGTELEFAL